MTRTAERRRKAGLCIGCGDEPEPGQVRCITCLKKQADYRWNRNYEQWQAGVCIRCGAKHDRGTRLCGGCAEKQASSSLRSWKAEKKTHHHDGCGAMGAARFSDDWDEVDCRRCLACRDRPLKRRTRAQLEQDARHRAATYARLRADPVRWRRHLEKQRKRRRQG